MVTLTKIDGRKITINADEIETIESSHDTLISLISGKKIVVKEKPAEITELVIAYRKSCFPDNSYEKK